MELKIKKTTTLNQKSDLLLICNSINDLNEFNLSKDEMDFVKKSVKNKTQFIPLNQYKRWVFIQLLPEKKKGNELKEELRKAGSKLKAVFNKNHIKKVILKIVKVTEEEVYSFLEGIVLSHYTFTKYFENKEDKSNKLEEILVHSKELTEEKIEELKHICDSVYFARTLVNEPLSYLNAKKLADEIKAASKEAGFSLEVLGKKQIESLKMGGLLAVNQGSDTPPNFSILTWKPENAKNKQPIILVGKGIVYDTGGLSLKPTANSMDYMKSDMGGAAIVAATLAAISKLKLPYYVIGLIPATDNAISNKAYVPGDIIKMHNKKTVEVLNTDAEGRLILADALSYASKYKPELVIDLATLTGAAAFAIGHYALVAMGTAPEKVFSKLEKSSVATHERIARFPFWDDYKDLLKSDVADIKNIGGRVAGAITAGKFLEYFTNYPWVHFDIAGPAYMHKGENYYTSGGTGFGVRLLVDFIRNYS
jgi:leucyl aminopeptidase